jgi:hypothetical protein
MMNKSGDSFLSSRTKVINKLVILTSLFGAILVTSFPAQAHNEEYFDSRESPHGGQMRMTGPYHLELVLKDKEILLYVMDHADSKISIKGGSGKATIQTGKDKTAVSIKLEPAGDNIFKGIGNIPATPETVIIVFIDLPETEAHSARFTPFKPTVTTATKVKAKPRSDDSSGHHHHHQM